MALTMDDAITIKDDRRPLSLTNEMQQVQEKGDLDNWRCRMKRKILASTLSCCTMLRGFIDRKNSCRSITARTIGAAGGYRHSLSNRG